MSVDTCEDELLIFQRSDNDISNIIKILQKKVAERNKIEKSLIKNYVLRDGILYKQIMRDNKVCELYVVPKAMRKSIVIRYHD